MNRCCAAPLLAWCIVALPAADAAMISGSVIGEGGRPIAGAIVQAVRDGETPCATISAADGTFALPCSATGRYAMRASFADLRPWTIDDVELGPDRELHLNFMLLPATAAAMDSSAAAEPDGFWTRRLPNPVVGTWSGNTITLRLMAIVTAAVSFVLGGLTMLALGRRFGVRTRSLSADEVGDMILNPTMAGAGRRLTPIATVGARGASATVSFGADEIAAVLAERRYVLAFTSLVVAPGLFALSTLGFAAAMLIGQEAWLFYAMLLVPAGFVLTPIVIGVQALARTRSR